MVLRSLSEESFLNADCQAETTLRYGLSKRSRNGSHTIDDVVPGYRCAPILNYLMPTENALRLGTSAIRKFSP